MASLDDSQGLLKQRLGGLKNNNNMTQQTRKKTGVTRRPKTKVYKNLWWRKEYPEKYWICFESFPYFLAMTWKFLLPNAKVTPVQNDIARYLQEGTRRRIIEAFRGVGKSWITAAYVNWRLLRNPQYKIMVVSASKGRADDFTTFTLALIRDMPLLKHLYPTRDQRQSKVAFDVAPAAPDQSPSVKSVGVLGQMAGSRADEIIADDVEVPNNSETQGMQDKLAERVKEFDAVLKPNGIITYLGTPQCEGTLYNKLIPRGYSLRVWPSRFPDPKTLGQKYGDTLAPFIAKQLELKASLAGLPTDPSRFDSEDLLEREASYGRSGFALQFQLDTSLSDANKYPLKLSDLIIMGCDAVLAPERPLWSDLPKYRNKDLECVGLSGDHYNNVCEVFGDYLAYQGITLSIDPSGRGKDETAYCVTGFLNGNVYLLKAGGFAGGYSDETLGALAGLAKQYKVTKVLTESNFGDGMFTELLKPHLAKVHHQCEVEEVRHNIQKEKRIIDTLEPIMNQHRLIVCSSVIQQDRLSITDLSVDIEKDDRIKYQLFYQMSRITKQRGALAKDDRLDVLAMAVANFIESMAMDAGLEQAARDARRRQAGIDMNCGLIDASIDQLCMGLNPLTQAHLASGGGGSNAPNFGDVM